MLIYKQNLINFNIYAELSNAPSQIKPEKNHNSNFIDWALIRSYKRKIETAEIRFLRRVAGYTRRDEISNLTILSDIQIFYIKDKIKDTKNECHDHIQRMGPYIIVHKAAEYKPTGHRDIGRSTRRWEDDFRRFLYDRNRPYGDDGDGDI
jgi:hypothetical protein